MSYRRKKLEAMRKLKTLKRVKYDDYLVVNKQCLKKSIYPSLGAAKKYVNKIELEGRGTMRVYQCNICRFYHLTSTRQIRGN